MSSPGSMTMASCVASSPMTEQLHCSGPTGKILWIMRAAGQWLLGIQGLWFGRGLLVRRGQRLRLLRSGLGGAQNRAGATAARSVHRERDRGQHKDHGRPGGRFRQKAGGAARTKSCLAPHAAKCGRDVGAGAALQQYDNHDEHANGDVDQSNQSNHASFTSTFLYGG